MTVVVLCVLGFGAMVAVGRGRRRIADARRRLDVEDAVAPCLEVVMVVVSTGGSVREAVRVGARRGPAATRPHFSAVLRSADAGTPLARALGEAAIQAPPLAGLFAVLVGAERDGAPIAATVLRLGDEARAARRRRRERRARELSVQLLFPLVCCSLPAVLVGAVLPLAFVALRGLWSP